MNRMGCVTKQKRNISKALGMFTLLLLSTFLFGCTGYSRNESTEFNYNSQPGEFIVKLKPNQNYKIVRGNESFPFSVTLKKDIMGENGTMHLIWHGIDRKSNMLRAHERVPYLIHANGRDFLYIYGEKYGDLNFIELSDTGVRGSDNTNLHFYEEPKDPQKIPVRVGISVLGPVSAEMLYRVGKMGRPVPNDPDGYRYCTETDRKQKFVTEKECNVLVFASVNAMEGKEEKLPAGSVFSRLRCSGDENTDLLLEDGRVFRVRERYLFSEPHAIMEVSDLTGKSFVYKVINSN